MGSYKKKREYKLHDLPLGTTVSSEKGTWEYKTGDGYTGSGITKRIEWLVIGINHYNNNEVVLMAKELIGLYKFDDSREDGYGNNGYSASHIRSWINSTFYDAMSNHFKSIILKIQLENKFFSGTTYHTQDNVFLLSTTELNLGSSPTIGTPFAYFDNNEKRVGKLNYSTESYWTRTPSPTSYMTRVVNPSGFLNTSSCHAPSTGVRTCVAVKGDVLVDVDSTGIYVIKEG